MNALEVDKDESTLEVCRGRLEWNNGREGMLVDDEMPGFCDNEDDNV